MLRTRLLYAQQQIRVARAYFTFIHDSGSHLEEATCKMITNMQDDEFRETFRLIEKDVAVDDRVAAIRDAIFTHLPVRLDAKK